MNKVVGALYSVFIAVLVTFFVGVTISVFYPMPEYPEPSGELKLIDMSGLKELTSEEKQLQLEHEDLVKQYEEDNKIYSRNVSLMVLGVSVVLMVLSLTLLSQKALLNWASLLGGIFLLVYSIIMGFASDDAYIRFAVVTVALITATVVGYIKLVKKASVEVE